MRAFEYTSPRTADDAVRMLSAEGAVALAGGTDLLSLMKDGAAAPSRLVNLKAIQDLTGRSRGRRRAPHRRHHPAGAAR